MSVAFEGEAFWLCEQQTWSLAAAGDLEPEEAVLLLLKIPEEALQGAEEKSEEGVRPLAVGVKECRNGHELTPENMLTRWHPKRQKHYTECRTCRRKSNRRYWEQKGRFRTREQMDRMNELRRKRPKQT